MYHVDAADELGRQPAISDELPDTPCRQTHSERSVLSRDCLHWEQAYLKRQAKCKRKKSLDIPLPLWVYFLLCLLTAGRMKAIEQYEAALLRALVRFSRGQGPSGPGASYHKLEVKGWVRKRIHEVMRKEFYYELTPEGKRIVKLATEGQGQAEPPCGG